MREDEAKTRWCPFARASNANDAAGTTVNRKSGGMADSDCFCIGSACMAWRWISVSQEADDEIKALGYRAMNKLRGFCGLAGKP